jgi:uncharacterized protein YcnI
MRPRTRRRSLLALAAAVGLLGLSPAAWADVRVSPDQARQGDGADLTFQVVEDEPGAWTTAVQLVLPADTPIAEVYPLSVPDWTPKIAYGSAKRPVPAGTPHAHGDGSTVTTSITWYRAGKPAGGAPSELMISLAPLPQSDRLAFGVVQTYSDGRVRRWAAGSGPVVRLEPAAPAPATPAPAAAADDAQQTAATTVQDGPVPAALLLVAGATAGLLIGVLVLGRRRRTAPEEAPLDAPSEVLEPVSED